MNSGIELAVWHNGKFSLKMNSRSFTHPHVIPKLYDFYFSSAEHKRTYFENIFFMSVEFNVILDSNDFHCMDKNSYFVFRRRKMKMSK